MAMQLLSSPMKPAASKWLGFVCAIWVEAIAGNNYTFSNALKSLMSLSQLQLNNLSVAKDVGKAFGLLAGLASDRLPTSLILIIGGLEGLIGYGTQWLVVSARIQPLSYWQMCVFLCMGGNSTTWMNTAVLVTCMRNFKNNQGPVSGILKGYLGLSSAIFTDLCTALFSSDPSAFLLILALIPAVVCLIAAFFLHESPPAATEERQQSHIFLFFNVVAFTVAIYLSIFNFTGSHGQVVSLVFAIGLLVLLVAPLVVPIYLMVDELGLSSLDSEGQGKEPLLLITNEGGNVKVVSEVKLRPMIGEDHTIVEALLTVDFWVLFVSFLCGVGTGLCVSNNLGQMGAALGYAGVSIFVSLTSIWGFFGRIISGMASEHYIKKLAMPRPIWNAVTKFLMIIGYAVMAVGFSCSLYVGSILVGMCYGVQLAVTIPIASDLFGLKSYGLLYNILIVNLPLGSFLFSGLLAGYLYDAQAVSSGDGGSVCTGPHCYRLVFVIMAAACGFGWVLDMVLVVRTRKVYRKIFERKNSYLE
nr:protein NUCLEAR FUSION DEFECTIVE 4-like [Ipomoea batatas]